MVATAISHSTNSTLQQKILNPPDTSNTRDDKHIKGIVCNSPRNVVASAKNSEKCYKNLSRTEPNIASKILLDGIQSFDEIIAERMAGQKARPPNTPRRYALGGRRSHHRVNETRKCIRNDEVNECMDSNVTESAATVIYQDQPAFPNSSSTGEQRDDVQDFLLHQPDTSSSGEENKQFKNFVSTSPHTLVASSKNSEKCYKKISVPEPSIVSEILSDGKQRFDGILAERMASEKARLPNTPRRYALGGRRSHHRVNETRKCTRNDEVKEYMDSNLSESATTVMYQDQPAFPNSSSTGEQRDDVQDFLLHQPDTSSSGEENKQFKNFVSTSPHTLVASTKNSEKCYKNLSRTNPSIAPKILLEQSFDEILAERMAGEKARQPNTPRRYALGGRRSHHRITDNRKCTRISEVKEYMDSNVSESATTVTYQDHPAFPNSSSIGEQRDDTHGFSLYQPDTFSSGEKDKQVKDILCTDPHNLVATNSSSTISYEKLYGTEPSIVSEILSDGKQRLDGILAERMVGEKVRPPNTPRRYALGGRRSHHGIKENRSYTRISEVKEYTDSNLSESSASVIHQDHSAFPNSSTGEQRDDTQGSSLHQPDTFSSGKEFKQVEGIVSTGPHSLLATNSRRKMNYKKLSGTEPSIVSEILSDGKQRIDGIVIERMAREEAQLPFIGGGRSHHRINEIRIKINEVRQYLDKSETQSSATALRQDQSSYPTSSNEERRDDVRDISLTQQDTSCRDKQIKVLIPHNLVATNNSSEMMHEKISGMGPSFVSEIMLDGPCGFDEILTESMADEEAQLLVNETLNHIRFDEDKEYMESSVSESSKTARHRDHSISLTSCTGELRDDMHECLLDQPDTSSTREANKQIKEFSCTDPHNMLAPTKSNQMSYEKLSGTEPNIVSGILLGGTQRFDEIQTKHMTREENQLPIYEIREYNKFDEVRECMDYIASECPTKTIREDHSIFLNSSTGELRDDICGCSLNQPDSSSARDEDTELRASEENQLPINEIRENIKKDEVGEYSDSSVSDSSKLAICRDHSMFSTSSTGELGADIIREFSLSEVDTSTMDNQIKHFILVATAKSSELNNDEELSVIELSTVSENPFDGTQRFDETLTECMASAEAQLPINDIRECNKTDEVSEHLDKCEPECSTTAISRDHSISPTSSAEELRDDIRGCSLNLPDTSSIGDNDEPIKEILYTDSHSLVATTKSSELNYEEVSGIKISDHSEIPLAGTQRLDEILTERMANNKADEVREYLDNIVSECSTTAIRRDYSTSPTSSTKELMDEIHGCSLNQPGTCIRDEDEPVKEVICTGPHSLVATTENNELIDEDLLWTELSTVLEIPLDGTQRFDENLPEHRTSLEAQPPIIYITEYNKTDEVREYLGKSESECSATAIRHDHSISSTSSGKDLTNYVRSCSLNQPGTYIIRADIEPIKEVICAGPHSLVASTKSSELNDEDLSGAELSIVSKIPLDGMQRFENLAECMASEENQLPINVRECNKTDEVSEYLDKSVSECSKTSTYRYHSISPTCNTENLRDDIGGCSLNQPDTSSIRDEDEQIKEVICTEPHRLVATTRNSELDYEELSGIGLSVLSEILLDGKLRFDEILTECMARLEAQPPINDIIEYNIADEVREYVGKSAPEYSLTAICRDHSISHTSSTSSNGEKNYKTFSWNEPSFDYEVLLDGTQSFDEILTERMAIEEAPLPISGIREYYRIDEVREHMDSSVSEGSATALRRDHSISPTVSNEERRDDVHKFPICQPDISNREDEPTRLVVPHNLVATTKSGEKNYEKLCVIESSLASEINETKSFDEFVTERITNEEAEPPVIGIREYNRINEVREYMDSNVSECSASALRRDHIIFRSSNIEEPKDDNYDFYTRSEDRLSALHPEVSTHASDLRNTSNSIERSSSPIVGTRQDKSTLVQSITDVKLKDSLLHQNLTEQREEVQSITDVKLKDSLLHQNLTEQREEVLSITEVKLKDGLLHQNLVEQREEVLPQPLKSPSSSDSSVSQQLTYRPSNRKKPGRYALRKVEYDDCTIVQKPTDSHQQTRTRGRQQKKVRRPLSEQREPTIQCWLLTESINLLSDSWARCVNNGDSDTNHLSLEEKESEDSEIFFLA